MSGREFGFGIKIQFYTHNRIVGRESVRGHLLCMLEREFCHFSSFISIKVQARKVKNEEVKMIDARYEISEMNIPPVPERLRRASYIAI